MDGRGRGRRTEKGNGRDGGMRGDAQVGIIRLVDAMSSRLKSIGCFFSFAREKRQKKRNCSGRIRRGNYRSRWRKEKRSPSRLAFSGIVSDYDFMSVAISVEKEEESASTDILFLNTKVMLIRFNRISHDDGGTWDVIYRLPAITSVH